MKFKVLVLLVILPFLLNGKQPIKNDKIGFLIYHTAKNKVTYCKKVFDVTTAQDICDRYLPKKIDIDKDFINNNHVQITTDKMDFYVEKKRIIYSKKGKKKLKRIKNKRL